MQGEITPNLTGPETQALAVLGKMPTEHVAVTVPCLQLDAAAQGTDEQGRAVTVYVAQVILPKELIQVRGPVVLNQQGQAARGTLQAAIPLPPTLRFVIARSMLDPAVVRIMEETEKRAEEIAVAAGGAIPGSGSAKPTNGGA